MYRKRELPGFAASPARRLTFRAHGTAIGLGGIVLVSADVDLNKAAQAEGLLVEDPNLHS
jgi:hypothetical protein